MLEEPMLTNAVVPAIDNPMAVTVLSIPVAVLKFLVMAIGFNSPLGFVRLSKATLDPTPTHAQSPLVLAVIVSP